jgi:type I restriction enzyme S subunit
MRSELPFPDVIDFQEGPGIMARDFRDAGVPLIRLAGLSGGSLLTGCNHLDPEMVDRKWSHFRLEEGDTLISTSASLGRVARVTGQVRGAIAYTGLIRMRPRDERLRSDFIQYLVADTHFQRQVEAMGAGSVMRHFGPSHLRRMTLLVPPPSEQEAIASILGSLDDKINVNERMRYTADAAAATLFRLMTGSEGHEHTSVQTLIEQQVIVIGDGFRAKNSELGPEGLPFARAGNLNDGFDFATADRVPESRAYAVRAKCSLPGDVVFTSKGTVGRFALVDKWTEPFVYSPQLCFWRSLDHARLPPAVLLWWMQSPVATQQLDALKGQTDMADYVSLRDQRSIVISLPQPAIMQRLATALEPLAALVARLRSESRTLAKIRDALLPKLISGEIRISNAEDPVEEIGPALQQLGRANT